MSTRPVPTTLWHVWESTVSAAPHAVAILDAQTGEEATRAGLTKQAHALAASAPPEAIPGAVVAVASPNGTSWMVQFLAAQLLGLAALPLDPALPAAQQSESAAALGAHWLLDSALNWQRLPENAPRLPPDRCLLKTTSGSTGKPRALVFTSANMLADGRQIAATMGITPQDRNFGAIPFGHSYGLGNLVLPLIIQGTCLISSREILPEPLSEQIARTGATVFPSVPAVLRALAETSGDPARLHTLRLVISAGAPLQSAVARSFHARYGLPIQNFYGSSETGGICFDRTGEATLTGRSVGQPLDGVTVSLNETGQITVRSAAVVAPGEHTLADLGVWTPEGELTLTGRASPLANIGGKKVSPLTVERVLRDLNGVSDAWVGVQTRGTGDDFLLAAVETEQNSAEIRHALTERLPLWQVPRRLWLTPHFPRTARGKLDRQELENRCLRAEG